MPSKIERNMSTQYLELDFQKTSPTDKTSPDSAALVSMESQFTPINRAKNIERTQSLLQLSTSRGHSFNVTYKPNDIRESSSTFPAMAPNSGSEGVSAPELPSATPSAPEGNAFQPSASAGPCVIKPSKKRGRPRKSSDVTAKHKYMKRKPQGPDAPPPAKTFKVASEPEISRNVSKLVAEKHALQKANKDLKKDNDMLRDINRRLGGRKAVDIETYRAVVTRFEEAERRNGKLLQQNGILSGLCWEHSITVPGAEDPPVWNSFRPNTSFDDI
ncbi:hypothetical protein DL95DRAFT_415893 [Leptodontidium sp. 2 PMI_412]|nr:hypothetical protein DL95DRAFT_415893 [Leptodontidium sp. 2 PMI_412]